MKYIEIVLFYFSISVKCGKRFENNRDISQDVLAGVLDNTNRNFCVFGPIRKNVSQNTFSFGSKLCIDANQRIYTCEDGLELDFKKIWNCDNFVIQEQISGKCLQKENDMYFLGSCNTCLNKSFFNLTDRCLKPSLKDTIGTLLCDDIAEATRKNITKKQKSPLCKLMKIQKQLNEEVEDIVQPLGLRKMIDRIEKRGKYYDRMVEGPKYETRDLTACRDIAYKRRKAQARRMNRSR
ncbi:hypothetical protein EHP00_165 [Ecytonucleospora hepatopenaei]|uniref:Uncharacterized protein n=1 Tax=Ecytonucleospora hepatopenaei TaxID=646526 RepID=A0A1W0E6D2_9MICR|nr:hypothetical protein EHP00_165 [Ecytonucleospora hepatopenaei]